MLDKKNLLEMENYLKEEDSKREELLAKARIVLKNSKAAIYSIHRKELAKAKEYIDESSKIIQELKKIIVKYPQFGYNIDNALEEYCEACLFYGFVKEKKIPSSNDLKLDPVNYLGGLSDLTGELARMAVIEATAKNKTQVKLIRDLIDEVYGSFIRFDLRNGDLRKKGDAIKWNLNKVEELLYDLGRK
jgi:predicted translin family RNA/ssDNA-binding protein